MKPQTHEGIFKALVIIATIIVLGIFIGVTLLIGLTGAYADLSTDDRIALTVIAFIALFMVIVFAILGVLVYRDARKLGMNAWMWTLIAIFAPNGVGFIIYLVFRYNEKKKKRCQSCNYVLTDDYDVCPHCGNSVGRKCSECGKIVEKEWKVCPYCRTALK
jgi:RNA polymerase subunit RPABC4/transcription elongation factor Spt4